MPPQTGDPATYLGSRGMVVQINRHTGSDAKMECSPRSRGVRWGRNQPSVFSHVSRKVLGWKRRSRVPTVSPDLPFSLTPLSEASFATW